MHVLTERCCCCFTPWYNLAERECWHSLSSCTCVRTQQKICHMMMSYDDVIGEHVCFVIKQGSAHRLMAQPLAFRIVSCHINHLQHLEAEVLFPPWLQTCSRLGTGVTEPPKPNFKSRVTPPAPHSTCILLLQYCLAGDFLYGKVVLGSHVSTL